MVRPTVRQTFPRPLGIVVVLAVVAAVAAALAAAAAPVAVREQLLAYEAPDGIHIVALDGSGAGAPPHRWARGPELAVAPDHEVGPGQGALGGRPQRARPAGQAHDGDGARHGRPSPGHRSRP